MQKQQGRSSKERRQLFCWLIQCLDSCRTNSPQKLVVSNAQIRANWVPNKKPERNNWLHKLQELHRDSSHPSLRAIYEGETSGNSSQNFTRFISKKQRPLESTSFGATVQTFRRCKRPVYELTHLLLAASSSKRFNCRLERNDCQRSVEMLKRMNRSFVWSCLLSEVNS